jgi:hypothetical protein
MTLVKNIYTCQILATLVKNYLMVYFERIVSRNFAQILARESVMNLILNNFRKEKWAIFMPYAKHAPAMRQMLLQCFFWELSLPNTWKANVLARSDGSWKWRKAIVGRSDFPPGRHVHFSSQRVIDRARGPHLP